MVLQVSFHGFFFLLQCTKCSDHSSLTQMWCGERDMYQSRQCHVFGDSREPRQLPFPIPQDKGQAHGGPFFQGCVDRPRQKWKQSLGASLVCDFVASKHQHKWGLWWVHPERCIVLSLLVIQHLESRDCQVKWYFSPPSPSCILFPFFYLHWCTEPLCFLLPLLDKEREKLRGLVTISEVTNCKYHHIFCGDQLQTSMGERSRKPARSSLRVPSCWDKRDPAPCCCLPDPHSPWLFPHVTSSSVPCREESHSPVLAEPGVASHNLSL